MTKQLLLVLVVLIAVFVGCVQDDSLVNIPVPEGTVTDTTIPSGWQTPSPGPCPIPTASISIANSNCYGNANADQPYTADPDDPPGQYDTTICFWWCAYDPHTMMVVDSSQADQPFELWEAWDFDGNYVDEYNVDPGLINPAVPYPVVKPCYSSPP